MNKWTLAEKPDGAEPPVAVVAGEGEQRFACADRLPAMGRPSLEAPAGQTRSCGLTVMDRARRYLRKCPPAVSGQHGHAATFRVACALVQGFALSAGDALGLLREWNLECRPPWSEHELAHKVNSALVAPSQRAPGYLLGQADACRKGWTQPVAAVRGGRVRHALATQPRPHKVTFEPETLKRVAGRQPGVDAEYVKARSPVSPETQTPASFLQRLYRPGERVLVFDVFESQGLHVWERVEPPYDAGCLDHLVNGFKDGIWFLCNPVDGEWHPNPRLGGRRSRRSEESVTAWRYLVLESDQVQAGDWLAILVQLPLRIAAIYGSGGRSIHALVRVDCTSKTDWDAKARRLKPLMTILGADPGAITAVRLTRLPGCYRMQEGPPGRRRPRVRKRWIDEPLEFDQRGDPIWSPSERGELPAENLWAGGTLQELLYLNPEPDLTPIRDRPTRQRIHEQWLAQAQARAEKVEVN